MFEYKSRDFKLVDILNKDRKVLFLVLENFCNNYFELKCGDYIDEDLEFFLFVLYFKVVKN